MGTLDVAGVCFDVSGAALLQGDDSVCVVSRLVMLDDRGDGDWFPMTMTARSWTGGSRCCGWLYFVMRGAGLVATPINGRERTVVLNQRGGVMNVRIVYTQQESVEVLQVTRSLLLLILVCIVLYLRSYCYNQSCLCQRKLLHPACPRIRAGFLSLC